MEPEAIVVGEGDRRVACQVFRPLATAKPSAGALFIPSRPLLPSDYEWLIAPLTKAGMTIAGLLLRGFGSPGADDRSGPETVDTVEMALAALVARGVLSNRVALIGHGSGAQTALLVAAEEVKVKAVVALAPISDLSAHVKAIRAYLPDYEHEQRAIFGEVYEDAEEQYAIRSPIRYLDTMRIPILLMVGEQDMICPPYQSKILYDELRRRKIPARIVVLRWLGHFFESFGFGGYEFEEVVAETRRWIRKHLGDGSGTHKTKDAPRPPR